MKNKKSMHLMQGFICMNLLYVSNSNKSSIDKHFAFITYLCYNRHGAKIWVAIDSQKEGSIYNPSKAR